MTPREGVARHFASADDRSADASWRIEPGYIDARGQRRQTAPAVIMALARALGIEGIQNEAPPRRVIALRAGEPPIVPLVGMAGSRRWQLFQASQAIASGETTAPFINLPSTLPIGSYRLVVDDAVASELLVIVAPREACQPLLFRDGGRAWLLAVQLYGIRSSRNWGHGDFTDLAQLLQIAAQAGAAGVGVNPLHALSPGQASPYSPSSRLFLNPLYIDIDAIPEIGSIGAGAFAAEASKLRTAELVDYLAVCHVKTSALRIAYAAFSSTAGAERRKAFDAFCTGGGKPLKLFCAFEHLRERFGNGGWQRWPAEWHDAGAALEKLDPDEIEFHAFTQWIAHEQLAACRDLAHELGLPVGLYLDMAVGVDAGGADAWALSDAIPSGLSVGAPPDVYNPAGQNWGLAGPHPQALIDTDFAPYRQALRSAMQYAGAIRIDHALGLNRLFLIPSDESAAGGGYVSFPFDAMLAVTAQESAAHRCLVVGEDLGTIPEGVCETLNQWGVWSYRVALFERENDAHFRMPEHFPRRAIVTFNTHDLPTFSGWTTAHDLKTKHALALDPGETGQERERALTAMRNTLAHQGMPPELSLASVLRYLARTQSQLLAVGIEDILGLNEQSNIPGTIDEHPNWRRKLPVSLDEFAGSSELHRIATVLAEEGRGFARTG